MKLNNLKNYITSNLLALYGYFVVAGCLYYDIILKPLDEAHEAEMMALYGVCAMPDGAAVACIIIYFLITLLILFLIFIEFLIRRKFKYSIIKFTDNKIYSVLFWLGAIIVLFPFLFIVSFAIISEHSISI